MIYPACCWSSLHDFNHHYVAQKLNEVIFRLLPKNFQPHAFQCVVKVKILCGCTIPTLHHSGIKNKKPSREKHFC